MNPRADDWSAVRRVLCVRLDNMGDVLMTTPAIRALKESQPGRHISLWASPSGSVLAPYLPDVDAVLPCDAAWVKNGATGNEQDWAAIAALRNGEFDAAVIFTVYSQSALPAALICHLAGIPRVLAHARENPYRLLNPWIKDTEPDSGIRHEVQRQLDLVAHVGARCADNRLRFNTSEADRQSLRRRLREQGMDHSEGGIVVHCGATAESRRYGADGFAQALALLHSARRPIFLTGSHAERPLTEHVAALAGEGLLLCNLAGCLTLGELACLIEDAHLLISNNTGPVHIAAAVQTPVVDLYALTNPQHTPWMVQQRVLSCDVPCKYCYRSVCPQGHNACLSGIPPEAVAKAAYELLEDQACIH